MTNKKIQSLEARADAFSRLKTSRLKAEVDGPTFFESWFLVASTPQSHLVSLVEQFLKQNVF